MSYDDLLPLGEAIASRHLAFVLNAPVLARARKVMDFVAARTAFADRFTRRWHGARREARFTPRWPDGVAVRAKPAIGHSDPVEHARHPDDAVGTAAEGAVRRADTIPASPVPGVPLMERAAHAATQADSVSTGTAMRTAPARRDAPAVPVDARGTALADDVVVRPKRVAGAVPIVRPSDRSTAPSPERLIVDAASRTAVPQVASSHDTPTVKVAGGNTPPRPAPSTSVARGQDVRVARRPTPAWLLAAASPALIRSAAPLTLERRETRVPPVHRDDRPLFWSASRERNDAASALASPSQLVGQVESAPGSRRSSAPWRPPATALEAVEAHVRPADGMSIDDLVDRVVRRLSREVTIEAERRGVTAWHSRS